MRNCQFIFFCEKIKTYKCVNCQPAAKPVQQSWPTSLPTTHLKQGRRLHVQKVQKVLNCQKNTILKLFTKTNAQSATDYGI